MDFSLSFLDYIRILLSIGAVFTIPGWAILSITDYWKSWHTLQRWIIAVGLSIAFYPILFYWARILTPSIQIGPNKNLAILIMGFVFTAWKLRKNWKTQFQFDRLELFAILIFLGTLFTRYYIAYTHPFPAWSDSLHHTLITNLVGLNGKLPYTLDPYAPTPLDMYHLGLYSLTGTVMQLANVPAHTSLLWTSQTLNGLCGLGIYLVLDRKVSRIGAITGATVAGLISHMPAFYVNWGRFTQIASQTILPIAWLLFLEMLSPEVDEKSNKKSFVYKSILAATFNGAVFFLHFRVAGFYLPLVLITLIYHIRYGIRKNQVKSILLIAILVGFISILLILPVLRDAMSVYLTRATLLSATGRDINYAYHQITFDAIKYLVMKTTLLCLGFIGIILILVKRNHLGILLFIWCLTLIGIGKLYLINIPIISFTNLSGILIMFYFPLSLILGIGMNSLILWTKTTFSPNLAEIIPIILIITFAFWGGIQRINDTEEYRYFNKNEDLRAFEWIKNNIPRRQIFGIDTQMWLNSVPQGINGGYWIPYFTNHSTTTGTMLSSLYISDYYQNLKLASQLITGNFETITKISKLCDLGINYLYLSESNMSVHESLSLAQLDSIETTEVVYQRNGISIVHVCPIE